jgi:hypothetical protein
MILKSLAGALFMVASSGAVAASAPEHSKVAISQKKDGDSLAVVFKVEPNKGMNITLDAPWKLDVEAKDLSFAKTTLAKSDMDTALPGFILKTVAKPAASQGQLKYTLTSFICTKEKTQCYREVHTGTFDWNLQAP